MKITFTAMSLALIFWACSCNQHSSSDNPIVDKLAGGWVNVANVVDTAGNHTYGDHDLYDSIHNNYVVEYYAGGNGQILLNGASAGNFTWQLLDNNTYLKTTLSGAPSTTQYIDSLTSTTLILLDTTGISYTWMVFAKQ